jgi:hypothetical protein
MDDRNAVASQCPLCGNKPRSQGEDPTETSFFDCEVCGRFGITFELMEDRDMQGQVHPYLSAATRKANLSRRRLVLTTKNWQVLEDEQRSIRVSQKLVDLLRLIAERSATPGRTWELHISRDYPLIAAHDPAELLSYLRHFEQLGFVRYPEGFSGHPTVCELTITGWNEIEPMPSLGGVPGRCLVAISFDPSLDSAYNSGIKPAIEDCGFSPVCMKEVATNEGITDRIMSEIRLAQFVVADFTGQRGGVYFEAGFARGLGREVIWACREDELSLVHFDIKHYGHVVWKAPDDLRQKLAESIRANIIPKR